MLGNSDFIGTGVIVGTGVIGIKATLENKVE